MGGSEMKTNSNIILWCLAGSVAGNLILRAYWMFVVSGGNPIELYRSAGLLYFAMDLANALMGIAGLALLLGYAKSGTRGFLAGAAVLFALTPGMSYAWPHAAFAALLFWQTGRAPLAQPEEGLGRPALRLLQVLIVLQILWDVWFTSGTFDWTVWVLFGLYGLCLILTVVSMIRFRLPLLRAALVAYVATALVLFVQTWGFVHVLAPQLLLSVWLIYRWLAERAQAKSSCAPGAESIE